MTLLEFLSQAENFLAILQGHLCDSLSWQTPNHETKKVLETYNKNGKNDLQPFVNSSLYCSTATNSTCTLLILEIYSLSTRILREASFVAELGKGLDGKIVPEYSLLAFRKPYNWKNM